MIIQCDQCKTRFRLDDSKVTEAGVKVRCSRCKHTFVVKKEASEESVDFSDVMQGLDDSFEEGAQREDVPGGDAIASGDSGREKEAQNAAAWTPASTSAMTRDDDNDDGSLGVENINEGIERALPDAGALASGRSEDATGQSWEIHAGTSDATDRVGNDTQADFFFDGTARDGEKDEFMLFGSDEPAAAAESVADDRGVGENDSMAQSTESFEALQTEDGLCEQAAVAVSSMNETVSPGKGEISEVCDEELPPLAISSRRKKTLSLPAALAVIILLALAASGAGLYFSGTDLASINLSRLHLPGDRQPSDTGADLAIAIRNLDGAFIRDKNKSELFVVRGEAYNQSDSPCTSFQVKGYIFGADEAVVMERNARIGSSLSNEELAAMSGDGGGALPMVSPEENVIQPGTGASFHVIFRNVPAGAASFGAEVIGPAAKVR